MNEIEKMYENVRLHKCTNIGNFCKHIGATCERCKKHKYPPFTAEKQIEIIKFLIGKRARFNTFKNHEQKDLYMIYYECGYIPDQLFSFEEALAESVNYLWQDLSEEEKQQVKRILGVG